jgi:hypothetical protein
MQAFRYALGQNVTLMASGERGIIIGRAEYLEAFPGYLVRYRAADGRATEGWWTQPALENADDVGTGTEARA